MIVVVTGSRSLAGSKQRLSIKECFVNSVATLSPTAVHHGGASGPDMWAWGAFHDIQITHSPKQTPGRTPAQRLYDRNITMIVEALRHGDVTMVTCWDGVSNGTRHAMNYARELGILLIHTHEIPEEDR